MRPFAMLLLALSAAVAAQPSVELPDISGPELPVETLEQVLPPPARPARDVFGNLRREADVFTLVNEKHGLSLHKPMFLMPLTWSPDFSSANSEVLFQISLKQRLFNRNLFFAYTQRSFWQLYNGNNSRPFRETNYNTELFYRWKPEWRTAPGLGFDLGIDHESNGRELPESRSWNRVIVAGYHESQQQLLHLRFWYRLPEDQDRTGDDPKRDDNPDIQRYLGYGELRLQRKFRGARQHAAALMLRGNPQTGRGAVQLGYSGPFSDYAFWTVHLWHGYGESLIDYDRSISRIGVGFMLAR